MLCNIEKAISSTGVLFKRATTKTQVLKVWWSILALLSTEVKKCGRKKEDTMDPGQSFLFTLFTLLLFPLFGYPCALLFIALYYLYMTRGLVQIGYAGIFGDSWHVCQLLLHSHLGYLATVVIHDNCCYIPNFAHLSDFVTRKTKQNKNKKHPSPT